MHTTTTQVQLITSYYNLNKNMKIKSEVDQTFNMPLLADPKSDRQVKSIIPPIQLPLSWSLIFTDGKVKKIIGIKPNWRNLMHHFKREGRIAKEHLFDIVRKAAAIFSIENLTNRG